jgi:hypothetical protein
MNTDMQNSQDPKEQMLWEIARKRASFKSHLFSYIVVNGFFWALWYFGDSNEVRNYPWPLWPTLGWGIGLAFHFIGAYVYPQEDAVRREYEKLKNQK